MRDKHVTFVFGKGRVFTEEQKRKYDYVRTVLTVVLREVLDNDHYRAEYYVTGKADCAAKVCDIVPVLHYELTDGGGVNASVINLNIGHFFHLFNVSDSAPDYSAAVFSVFLKSSC